MRSLLFVVAASFLVPAAAQDGTRFRLEIAFGDAGPPFDVDAELGKRFAAERSTAGAPMRLEGEIVRSSLAHGREVLDVEVTVSKRDAAQWQPHATTTLKLHVGRRGATTVADASGDELEIAARATRL